jgi:TRAP-type C4-dicarboxylate transport system permease small subunit
VEKAYAVWRAFQEKFLARATALILLGCTLLALAEVVRRYVFGWSYEWQQDAVTFFIVSAVFLFFGISQRREAHLSVTVFVGALEALGPRARFAAELVKLVAMVISLLFLLGVVWWGIPELLESVEYTTRTESLFFYMWPFLAALLLGFLFMAITLFFQIYREYHRLRGRSVLEEPPEESVKLH